jgi:hypothetical protein
MQTPSVKKCAEAAGVLSEWSKKFFQNRIIAWKPAGLPKSGAETEHGLSARTEVLTSACSPAIRNDLIGDDSAKSEKN